MIRPAEILIALRSLRARKAYAVVTLATIMLIVGAGSAILAVINATFLRPLPFEDEDALVWIYSHPPGTIGTARRNPLHPPTFVAMREHLRVTPDFAGSWSRSSMRSRMISERSYGRTCAERSCHLSGSDPSLLALMTAGRPSP